MRMLVNATLKVRIPDCPGPERVMSVVAADPQMVVKVIQETFLKKYKYKYKSRWHKKYKYRYRDKYTYRQILLYCSSKRTMTNLIKFQPNSGYKHRYKRTRIFPHQVLEATIPYMYELNMDNQENEGAAERELRLLIHQSIMGGVSFFIIRSSSYHPHHDDDPHHIMYCHHKNLWVSFFVRTSSSYRENS